MCYFLYLASPLTLSEVRSMLPPGLAADLASTRDQQTLKALHPAAQTVARILAGRCSCDLIRPRLSEPREDERHLRDRYRRLGLPRDAMVTALERHRQAGNPQPPRGGWPRVLADFVGEHARNAGPTLYHLTFFPPTPLPSPGQIREVSVGQVKADPEGWLVEGSPARVSR